MNIIVGGLLLLIAVGSVLFAWLGRGELNRRIGFLENQLHSQEADFALKEADLEAKLRQLEGLRNLPGLFAQSERQRDESSREVGRLEIQLREQATVAAGRVADLTRELDKLHELSRIPNIMERARRLEAEVAARMDQARSRGQAIIVAAEAHAAEVDREAAGRLDRARHSAGAILEEARRVGEQRKQEILAESVQEHQLARLARINAETLARATVAEADAEAKRIATMARKEAKEKTQRIDQKLDQATLYALSIRRQAEARVEEIGGQAYEALRLHTTYTATALALKHRIEGYDAAQLAPIDHVLDELAYDFGFHRAGERLKLARERVKVMERNGTAATCQYPDGWKRDYAIRFVLDAFNGQVDALLARIKPAQHGKLAEEIRDLHALSNRNGEVFRNACIQPEFLDARLEELKWGVAVAKLKEQDREEQRALKERIKEEEKAARERAKAVEQAEREQALIAQAIEQAWRDHANAAAQDRERYEAKLRDLDDQLRAAEEKNRRAVSMAQQTKQGHVYVISNVGSFGEDVYKISLTRRLEPMERIRELGSASVPFGFDVHALIPAEDAPALEATLHRRFLEAQVNKVNHRKEFFRIKLHEIRAALDEMKFDVRWSLAAEAREYRDTLRVERADAGGPRIPPPLGRVGGRLRGRWARRRRRSDPRRRQSLGPAHDLPAAR